MKKLTELSTHNRSIVNVLRQEFPHFGNIIEASYLDGNKVMYYLLVADFYRYFLESYRSDNIEEVQRICAFIEKLINSTEPEVSTLGVVGFLELINSSLPEYDEIKKSTTPLLRQWMKKVENFWGA